MAAVKINQRWPLEKYARLLQDKQQSLNAQPAKTQSAGGSWKHYCSSANNTIQMSLLEDNHLMISSGNQIYESISLWEAKKWIKGITKGDSALFIYKINDENRRFRVKFSPTSSGESSTEACKHCSSILSSLIPMSEMPTPEGLQARQGGAESSQLSFSQPTQSYSQQPLVLGTGSKPAGHSAVASSSTADLKENSINPPEFITVPEIAKAVQVKGQRLGEAYASTNFPTEHLGPFIRLCLTDANFPAFVEAVERELDDITKQS